MKEINKVNRQIWDQINAQSILQVCPQVDDEVWRQVNGQVNNQLKAGVYSPIKTQARSAP